jgi:ribonuclease BN (tRNA processing enzyme)
MVQITFLGTGGDALVVSKQDRSSGGIILKGDGFQFHIDPGPSALARARDWKINIRETTALFVTSPNIIHSHDMKVIIYAMTYGGLDKHGILFAIEDLSVKAKEQEPNLDKVLFLRPNHREYIRNTEILATPSTHPGCGLKLTFDALTIGYPGETSYADRIAEKFKGATVLILHAQDAERFIDAIHPKLAILTYFTVKDLERQPHEIAKGIQKKTRVKTIAAEDGLSIDLDELFFAKDQKSLSSFLQQQNQPA